MTGRRPSRGHLRGRPSSAAGRRSVRARLERAVLGLAMSIAAFVIERRVRNAIASKGEAPPEPDQQGLDDILNSGIRISE
jgi:hypothetical protein